MTTVKAYSETFTAANILSVEAGSNCPQGGDYGHGGRTFIRLHDDAATSWCIKIDGKVFDQPREIEIALGGDHEAETFVAALEFAAKVIRGQIGCPMWSESHEAKVDF